MSNITFQSWFGIRCICSPLAAYCLGLPLALSVGIELVSSSARVTSVKSAQPLGLTDGHSDPQIGPQDYLGPIKIEKNNRKPNFSDFEPIFTMKGCTEKTPFRTFWLQIIKNYQNFKKLKIVNFGSFTPFTKSMKFSDQR